MRGDSPVSAALHKRRARHETRPSSPLLSPCSHTGQTCFKTISLDRSCPRKRRMTGSRSVELCSSAASTQRVGSTLDVMNDQVPTDGAQIEILVLMLRVLEH